MHNLLFQIDSQNKLLNCRDQDFPKTSPHNIGIVSGTIEQILKLTDCTPFPINNLQPFQLTPVVLVIIQFRQQILSQQYLATNHLLDPID